MTDKVSGSIPFNSNDSIEVQYVKEQNGNMEMSGYLQTEAEVMQTEGDQITTSRGLVSSSQEQIPEENVREEPDQEKQQTKSELDTS